MSQTKNVQPEQSLKFGGLYFNIYDGFKKLRYLIASEKVKNREYQGL